MTREQARAELLTREPDFLNQARQKANGQPTYICPVCGNGSGKDGDGIALDTSSKSEFPHWKCFSCELYADVLDLWRADRSITDYAEAFRTAYEYYGIIVESDSTPTEATSKPTQPRQPVKNKTTIPQSQGARNAFDSLSGVTAPTDGEQMEISFKGETKHSTPISRQAIEAMVSIVNQHKPEDYKTPISAKFFDAYKGELTGETFEILKQIFHAGEIKTLEWTGLLSEYDAHPEKFSRNSGATAPTNQETETQQDYSQFFSWANGNLSMTDYHRGISLDTLNRFCVGFVPNWRHPKAPDSVPTSPRLIIPTSKHSYIARDTRGNLTDVQKKFSKMKTGNVHIFNLSALWNADKPIFIVEGEIDAMSICDVGGEAVGIGSTSMIGKLIETLRNAQQRPAQPLIIALDNDKAGQEATAKLSEELDKLDISFFVYNIAEPYKDANKALNADRDTLTDKVEEIQNDPEEAIRMAQEAEYMQTSVLSHVDEFQNGIKESVNTIYIPTEFPLFDKLLDGGLYEGLYFIGAISSLGKTTFAMQMCDQIAESGYDVIIFSLEMARSELMAKSISRLTFLDVIQSGSDTRNAKTARGITTGSRYAKYSQTEKELIQRSITAYKCFAGNVFIHEGIGDIGTEQVRATVEKHISITGRKPVILIDYLQILAPADVRATDKQNTDKAVIELKRISRDFKIPVIGISSFNRDNYSRTVNMASFKESGAIEYSSDVLIGLQLKGAGKKNFDAIREKAKNPREIELIILKNRNGVVGKKILYNYYPMFNYFEEVNEEIAELFLDTNNDN